MDEFVQSLITGAPNLAIALLVLFWQHQRINRLEQYILEQNDLLTGKLLEEGQTNELPGGPKINEVS